MPVGAAYAIWSGLGTAAVATIGAVFFHERLNAIQVAAIAMIILGVVLLQVCAGGDAAP
jgi:small multidrug resistance pump